MERSTPCQRCSEPFDWVAADECPNCGWGKAQWVTDGRYGLSRQTRESEG